jgi:hypothetical protein
MSERERLPNRCRDTQGRALGPLGVALDLLAEQEGER